MGLHHFWAAAWRLVNQQRFSDDRRCEDGLAGSGQYVVLAFSWYSNPEKQHFGDAHEQTQCKPICPPNGKAAELRCPGVERSSWHHSGTSAGFLRSPPKHIFCSELTIPGEWLWRSVGHEQSTEPM